MLIVETIAKVRRDHIVDKKAIKEIARERGLSRNTVRKVLRSGETSFAYARGKQPYPKLGPYPRQRRTTVMLNVPERFINETLWPEFKELNQVLVDYLSQVTERIISEEVFSQTAEAQEVDEPLRLPG
jgi:predicted transcriptional regulator